MVFLRCCCLMSSLPTIIRLAAAEPCYCCTDGLLSVAQERVVQVSRVTKVVKGGKSMSFRCVPSLSMNSLMQTLSQHRCEICLGNGRCKQLVKAHLSLVVQLDWAADKAAAAPSLYL